MKTDWTHWESWSYGHWSIQAPMTWRPAQVTRQFFKGESLNCSFPRPGVRMKKNSLGCMLPGHCGTQMADGLIWRKKICQLVWKTLVWEKNVSLSEAAPAAPSAHPRKRGGLLRGLSWRSCLHVPHMTRLCTRCIFISVHSLSHQGPMC